MVGLYAAMGVMMLTGIMAIFEMGLSLTGQSLRVNPSDEYLSNAMMKGLDARLLAGMSGGGFAPSVANSDLCSALDDIEPGWVPIGGAGYWSGSCHLTKGSHRIIVRGGTYQLFSCALGDGESKCSFEVR